MFLKVYIETASFQNVVNATNNFSLFENENITVRNIISEEEALARNFENVDIQWALGVSHNIMDYFHMY